MHFVLIHPRALMSIDKLGNCNINHQDHPLVSMTQELVISLLVVYKLIKEKKNSQAYIDWYSIQNSKSGVVGLPFSEGSYG